MNANELAETLHAANMVEKAHQMDLPTPNAGRIREQWTRREDSRRYWLAIARRAIYARPEIETATRAPGPNKLVFAAVAWGLSAAAWFYVAFEILKR